MAAIDPSKKWTHPLPIWASRPDGSGMIASFFVPLWLLVLIGMLILLNAVVWGVVGLVAAVLLVL